MSNGSRWLPILTPEETTFERFVEFWAEAYRFPDEPLYEDNIGKPLTPDRIDALFRWKNGGTLSARKAESVRKNYHRAPSRLDAAGGSASVGQLISAIDGGGATWNIFMLHIWRPDRFPIFDQHVHRAMLAIEGRENQELERQNDRHKIDRYVSDYLPFWTDQAGAFDGRALDKALWAFGKALKPPSGSGLDWSSILRARSTS